MPTSYFKPAAFKFLAELGAHNEKPWFEANKDRYLHGVRDPMLSFITDLQAPLGKLSKHFDVDPRPTGGSMMRIYRDVRFSNDKSPYKTAVAAHFSHRGGGEAAMAGFYLHLEPRSSMVGGGVWRPAPDALQKIRAAILKDPKGWAAVRSAKALGKGAEFHGEVLKRMPRGFDETHPWAEDLKRKDFAVGWDLPDRVVSGGALLATVVDGYRRMAPYMRFLCKALGLPF